jgi:hypothetical protein
MAIFKKPKRRKKRVSHKLAPRRQNNGDEPTLYNCDSRAGILVPRDSAIVFFLATFGETGWRLFFPKFPTGGFFL